MELEVRRRWLTPRSSIGELYVDGVFFCFTLEDVMRADNEPKVWGQTAIPLGRYPVVLNMSPKFHVVMPLLINVPGFEGVRVHVGNGPEDTEGCILVGTQRGPDYIFGSRDAYTRLFAVLEASVSQVFIDVTIGPGAQRST